MARSSAPAATHATAPIIASPAAARKVRLLIRGARGGGHSSWTWKKRAKLALDMLSAHSAAPIRVTSLIGIVACLTGIAIGDVSVAGAVATGSVLLAIGLLGEYAWRILDELRGGPAYIETREARVAPAAHLAREDG